METILDELDRQAVVSPQKQQQEEQEQIVTALQALAVALGNVQPLLLETFSSTATSASTTAITAQRAVAASATNASSISAQWLRDLVSQVPSELGTDYLAQQVWEIAASQQQPQQQLAFSSSNNESLEAEQQDALLNVLGFSEVALSVLEQLLPHMSEIVTHISLEQLQEPAAAAAAQSSHVHDKDDTTTMVDVKAERRHYLVQEAQEATELAALAQAEAVASGAGGGQSGSTHTVGFASAKQLQKQAEKAHKRAQQAWQRAKDSGALGPNDDNDLLHGGHASRSVMDTSPLGPGGLMATSAIELQTLQQQLLPEGAKQYYDHRGLPSGTVHESYDEYEKVVIPPQERDETQLHPRLQLDDVLTTETERLAFAGTTSLNPMQSTVFEKAYHHRDNLLVCAPTGAGKTNVALLTVVAHFRDAGLLDRDGRRGYNDNHGRFETGAKVVYIAPMKALAQEVVEKFSSKLKPLHLIVRELTGDMQLTRAEAESANVLVTTPEKWDVVTRKGGGDENSLGNQCGLLIIDEVHLLADDRGAVIESVVARLHRSVERRQRQVRIVALSATLPNYLDVAEFLQASPDTGTFFFGPEHRPVPLVQTFIGVTNAGSKDPRIKEQRMNQVCFESVLDSLRRGYQVMVFVHSRKGTADTANALAELAAKEGVLDRYFTNTDMTASSRYADKVQKNARNPQMKQLFDQGMGIHHAGMLRNDRKLTEQMFFDGAIKVLWYVCTQPELLSWRGRLG